jgi:hypothetical protein
VTESSTGFPTWVGFTTFEGRRYLGNLTGLAVEGNGTFGAAGTATWGTINYTASGTQSVDAVDGQGATRRALRVDERVEYNGTLGGASYFEVNASQTLQAASDKLVFPDIFSSWNTTGHVGVTSLAGTGSRFLDSDGDGTFNPDPRPDLPYDGQFFTGLAPAELIPGDAFTLTNGLGAAARMVASNPRTEVLAAAGFTPEAVEVVDVGGEVAGGGLAGATAATVVANGAHSHLHLHASQTLVSATGHFASVLVLAARGP